MRRSFSLQTHFFAALTFSSLVVLCGALVYLNCLLKEEALENAQKLAMLLAYQKLSTGAYLSTVADPGEAASRLRIAADRKRLAPEWILSGEVVRRLDDEFRQLDQKSAFQDYSFRICTDKACSPESATDELEQNFLTRLSEDASLQEWHGVREFAGKEYFVQMFRGATFSGNASHTARMQLAHLTGDDNPLREPFGNAVSAISIRIPLGNSYALANRLTLQGALFIIILLIVSATIHLVMVRKNILAPLEELHTMATRITDDRRHLGQTISLKSNRELNDLAQVFNRLSVTLGEHHRDLHRMIDERTRELREEQERLQHSESQVRLLLDSAAEAIYGVDPDGKGTFCNPAALKLLGCQHPDELLGRQVFDFFQPPDQPAAAPDPTWPAYRNGQFVHLEKMALPREDGSTCVVELWAHPMLHEGVCHGAVVSFVDITERLNLQRQNLRAAQLASIGEIATGVAHEVNNPINGVINYSQYLISKLKAEKTAPEDITEILHKIIREGTRVATIVRNLLFFARDSGNLRNLISMQSLFDDVFCLSGSQLESSGINVTKVFPDEPVLVQVNPQQIEQVLLNLINNARYALSEKAATSGEEKALEISLWTESDPTGPRCYVSLLDNGIGIPAILLTRLGTPFVTTKPAGVGTGLGLSISQEIIRQHGGRMTIESREHEYTRVVIALPLVSREEQNS